MKRVYITYFVHGTTTDNENGIATGQSQGELSKAGREQAIMLKDLIKGKKFEVVFCSDLKRAVDSAELCFGSKVKIIQDKRLRECDYGKLTGADAKIVYPMKIGRISKPFPGGESFRDVEKRIRSFLEFLLEKYPGKNVAIMAHQAPQLAIEVIINGKTWKQAIEEDWRDKVPKGWKPGWEYIYGNENVRPKLKEFIISAKKKGYASGEAKKRLPDGSKEIRIAKGKLEYADRYWVYKDSSGKEIGDFNGREEVFLEGKPAWKMEYCGRILDEKKGKKEIEEVYSFLRNCLKRLPESAPYRGPRQMALGKFKYLNSWKGDIGKFSGRESIIEKGKKVYSLEYSGKAFGE